MNSVVTTFRSQREQLTLFRKERILKSLGAVRSWSGDFWEEATAEFIGGRRFKTDGRFEFCPDILFDRHEGQVFVECKGSGRSSQIIVYDFRFEKERSALCPVVYAIWCHDFAMKEVTTDVELRRGLASHCRGLIVCHHDTLSAVIGATEPRRVNSGFTKNGERNGYGTKQYGMGWTIRVSRIKSRCTQLARRWRWIFPYGHCVNVRDVWADDFSREMIS